jgi:hypothetical protein
VALFCPAISKQELLAEDRCENLRSKTSKIPRRTLMSRFKNTVFLMLELHFGAFHIREQRFC